MTNDDVANDTGPLRLPIELIALICSFLVDTSSLHTLAKLNQASHLVQQETIGPLFQTTIYKCEPSFLRTVGYGIPKGWAHTRNLLLNDTTRALMEHHFGFLKHFKLIDEPCISVAFPKLEFFALTNVDGCTRLKIHKPMSLAGILERLDINTHTERSFYGNLYRQEPTAFPPGFVGSRLQLQETIVGLDFRDNAYLMPDDSVDEPGALSYVIRIFPQFRFQIRGSPPMDREAAISGLVRFIKCYSRIQQRYSRAVPKMLRIKFSAEWLELFVLALQKGRTLLYNVEIGLNTLDTFGPFKKHFTSLAEIYAANWSSRPTKIIIQPIFLSLTGLAFIVPASSDAPVATVVEADSNGYAHPHITHAAILMPGHRGEGDDENGPSLPGGFTGIVYGMTHGGGQPTRREQLFRKTYAINEHGAV